MAVIRLTIKREGSLLSQVLNVEISEELMEKIQVLALAEEDGFPTEVVVLERPARLEGIEQYQAEGR